MQFCSFVAVAMIPSHISEERGFSNKFQSGVKVLKMEIKMGITLARRN